ncbi:NAD-dependent succinate-semialdehyde dehydrogenase [Robertkochia flava]|uniref:NAD-dependent succinate-semialdehyde dehydrogenase n=1 Tax=Robertkochia flava TaxID=3447986 RepID=UPI001CCC911F|nr:NAD-dependent succinate-semialdehyde dehydrogenase [Robertkochia marina]
MIKTINPYNGKILGKYRELKEEEILEKLIKGEACYKSWKKVTIKERAQFFLRLKTHLQTNKKELAELMGREMGKPVTQGIAEIEKCAWLCEYYAHHADKFLRSEEIETDAGKSLIAYEPLGVIMAVMPWNFPFWQVFRFAVPTLMAGNTAVLKHASNVMGCATAIEKMFKDCGFPDGAFQNLVIGSEKVAFVLQQKEVKAVSLTGSERAGKAVAEVAGREIKSSLLELGGSNAFIVLEDADLKKAVEVAVNARYQNTGQSCIAAKRLLLQKGVAQEFLNAYIKRVKELKSGDPLEEDTYIGVMARKDLAETLEDQMKRSLNAGAELLLGGERDDAYFEPTVLKVTNTAIPVMQEETFGPLIAAYVFDTLDEAIDVSNSTAFGLGVSVFTGDPDRIVARSDAFEEGALFINELVKSDPRLPFGGVKSSGYGRELGRAGIRAFVNVKTIYVNY